MKKVFSAYFNKRGQIYVHPASCCANRREKTKDEALFCILLNGGCTRLCLWERETLVCTRPYVSLPLWYAVQQFNSNYSRNWNQKPLLTIITVSWMSLKDFFLGNETNHYWLLQHVLHLLWVHMKPNFEQVLFLGSQRRISWMYTSSQSFYITCFFYLESFPLQCGKDALLIKGW